jgi:hypothetical protein
MLVNPRHVTLPVAILALINFAAPTVAQKESMGQVLLTNFNLDRGTMVLYKC